MVKIGKKRLQMLTKNAPSLSIMTLIMNLCVGLLLAYISIEYTRLMRESPNCKMVEPRKRELIYLMGIIGAAQAIFNVILYFMRKV